MVKINPIEVYGLIQRSNLCNAAIHLPVPQPRALLEPMTREDYSLEIGPVDVLRRHLYSDVDGLM